jgi:hypothetical protein
LVLKGNSLNHQNGITFLNVPQPDTTIELAGQDDRVLTDVARLILEINLNGQVVEKSDLISRESSPGVWDADQTIFLCVF